MFELAFSIIQDSFKEAMLNGQPGFLENRIKEMVPELAADEAKLRQLVHYS